LATKAYDTRVCLCVFVSVVTIGDISATVSRIRSKTQNVYTSVFRHLTTETGQLHRIYVAGNLTKHFLTTQRSTCDIAFQQVFNKLI